MRWCWKATAWTAYFRMKTTSSPGVSSTKLARIDGLGQVVQVYELDGYELHHDIGFGQDGELLALAEDARARRWRTKSFRSTLRPAK